MVFFSPSAAAEKLTKKGTTKKLRALQYEKACVMGSLRLSGQVSKFTVGFSGATANRGRNGL